MYSPIALIGPTASGKSDLALQLNDIHPIEIISLDSVLVYKGMDIGTAKPTDQMRQTERHHLIDIISPLENYDAAQFVRDCKKLIREIQQRGHLPVIVGGTMMYYHALKSGLSYLPGQDTGIRQALQKEKEKQGLTVLYEKLCKLDPEAAKRIQPNDSQRIERALEVYLLSGEKLSNAWQNTQEPPLDIKTLVLWPENRKILHEKIAYRFKIMLNTGLIEEVLMLKAAYPTLKADLPAMRVVGYRQVWAYIEGQYGFQELVDKGIIATRQLAKRQYTWLKRWTDLKKIDPFENNRKRQKEALLRLVDIG